MTWINSWRMVSDMEYGKYSAFHIHEFCEILCILSGKVRIKTTDKTYVLTAGEMIILAPLELHSVEALEFPYERIGIHVNCDFIQQSMIGPALASVLSYSIEDSNPLFDLKGDSSILQLVEKIHDETKQKLPKSEEMLRIMVHQFLISLYRLYPKRFKNSVGDETMDSAKRYIESNIGNLPAVSDIAKMYYLTTSHFIARFKKHTGYTPKKYCSLLRMAKARCLLKETELSLTEVAEKCGFSDVNGFVRTFRLSMGVSPGRFRETEDI